jgi:outer membrane protein OmpA-like peptidoglycan-associated protein
MEDSPMKQLKSLKITIILLLVLVLLFGCAAPQNRAEEGARKGALAGAAGGAILGQIIGGNTTATLVGAGVGAMVGTAVGHSYGKKMDEQEAELRRQLAAEQARIQREADILSVTLMSDVLFDVGSASLKPESMDQIKKIGGVLTRYPETSIIVAGHTDSTGSADLNQRLSEQRAMQVKIAFVEEGVHPSRIETIGFGASAPVADNSGAAGRSLNRRVVITISPPEA